MGTPYHAQNPELLVWVYATLVESALSSHEQFVGPLSCADQQTFFEDSRRLVALLGVNEKHLPTSLTALYSYMDGTIDSGKIVVSHKGKRIAPFILAQTSPLMKLLTFPSARLTAGLLPPPLRDHYGFSFSSAEQSALDAFSAGARRAVPYLPERLRYVVQYRRAQYGL